ncbi:MAG: C_GCAxxG_C_C family protein [Clostridia bacterium]|nr:C_GCAxxG_C_C family protein [Clostridia bacterium]
MEKRDYAVILKHSGCNCAQAVLCAFAEETGLSEDLLKRMGCMEATCGALVGAEILLGLKLYQDRPVLANARQLHGAFTQRCGASLCKELKGRDTGIVLCECDDCVRHAVDLTQEFFYES